MKTVNLAEKFSSFAEYWKPHIAGEINDFLLKLVKFKGDFVWHHHDHEDELFLVVKGSFTMKYKDPDGREQALEVREGEFVVMPHGVEHCPCAKDEVHVILLEPNSTLNTGNVRNERTRETLEHI